MMDAMYIDWYHFTCVTSKVEKERNNIFNHNMSQFKLSYLNEQS